MILLKQDYKAAKLVKKAGEQIRYVSDQEARQFWFEFKAAATAFKRSRRRVKPSLLTHGI